MLEKRQEPNFCILNALGKTALWLSQRMRKVVWICRYLASALTAKAFVSGLAYFRDLPSEMHFPLELKMLQTREGLL